MSGAGERAELPEGFFPERLDAAIRYRGLGLQRLCVHLAGAGFTCSPATLSQWRHGRTRPGTVDAVRMLPALEVLLRVPSGYLVDAEQVERGEDQPDPAVRDGVARAMAEALPHRSEYAAFAAELGDGILHAVDTRACVETVRVDAERRVQGSRVVQVLEALRQDAERLVVGTQSTHGALRVIRADAGVRVGRRRIIADAGLVLHELVLEQPLPRATMTRIQYDVVPAEGPEDPPDHGWVRWSRGTAHPAPLLAVAADLAPEALPRHLHRGIRGHRQGRRQQEHAAVEPIGTRALALLRGAEDGAVELCWSWDEEPGPCSCAARESP